MKTITTTLAALFVFLLSSTANATPAAAPFIATLYGYGVLILNTESEVPACYNEETRLVKWVGETGYSFEVGGCDYEAKKDQFVVIK